MYIIEYNVFPKKPDEQRTLAHDLISFKASGRIGDGGSIEIHWNVQVRCGRFSYVDDDAQFFVYAPPGVEPCVGCVKARNP